MLKLEWGDSGFGEHMHKLIAEALGLDEMTVI